MPELSRLWLVVPWTVFSPGAARRHNSAAPHVQRPLSELSSYVVRVYGCCPTPIAHSATTCRRSALLGPQQGPYEEIANAACYSEPLLSAAVVSGLFVRRRNESIRSSSCRRRQATPSRRYRLLLWYEFHICYLFVRFCSALPSDYGMQRSLDSQVPARHMLAP